MFTFLGAPSDWSSFNFKNVLLLFPWKHPHFLSQLHLSRFLISPFESIPPAPHSFSYFLSLYLFALYSGRFPPLLTCLCKLLFWQSHCYVPRAFPFNDGWASKAERSGFWISLVTSRQLWMDSSLPRAALKAESKLTACSFRSNAKKRGARSPVPCPSYPRNSKADRCSSCSNHGTCSRIQIETWGVGVFYLFIYLVVTVHRCPGEEAVVRGTGPRNARARLGGESRGCWLVGERGL